MSNENTNKNVQTKPEVDGAGKDNIRSPTVLIAPRESSSDNENITEKIGEMDLSKCDKDTPNTGIAIKNVESDALKLLLNYDSDSSYSSETEIINFHLDNSRLDRSSSTSSSPSSSSSSSSGDEGEDDLDGSITNQSKGAIRKDPLPKSNGEFGMDDLPPVPDLSTLSLNVENESFIHMGNVMGIVDRLVTVAALPNTPAYDLDTLFFLEDGRKPLGFVFDVLGQVSSPIYAVRFNSIEDIKNLEITAGMKVYAAPQGKHTQYVFLQQLLKMKGSDASWLGDNEVPAEFADFSDDENECPKFRVVPHQKRSHNSDGDHKRFESTMNKRNLLKTKLTKYMDTFRETKYKLKNRKNPAQTRANLLPNFDPLVPPPNPHPQHQQQMHGFNYYPAPAPYLSSSEYLGVYPQLTPQPQRPGGLGGGGDNNNPSSVRGAQTPQTYSGFFSNSPGFVGNFTGHPNYYNNQFNEHPGPSHQS